MSQSFRRIKIDSNDTLYSKIVRTLANGRCRRCHLYFGFERLQCAHIIERGNHGTRFTLSPKFNAVPLCASCHDWFDSHKITALLFDESKRVLSPNDESYTWLVKSKHSIEGAPQNHWNYTWQDVFNLYALGHHRTTKYGRLEKIEIKKQLKEAYRKIEDSNSIYHWGPK